MLTDDREHVIKLPSKGQVLSWTDNDLRCIEPIEPHQIQILSRILDQGMAGQQNADTHTPCTP